MTSFSAHKGGVPQGSILRDSCTKVTFQCEEWDDGGYYDAPNSKWTPPEGRYRISTHFGVDGTNVIAQRAMHLWLYKNGYPHKALYIGRMVQSNASAYGSGSVIVEADGSDYFEMFIQVGAYSDPVAYLNNNGVARDHYWQGEAI